MKKYDIFFSDDENTSNKGFSETLEFCKEYIAQHNGTDHSYFKDYKGGTVTIVDAETGEDVYSEEVK